MRSYSDFKFGDLIMFSFLAVIISKAAQSLNVIKSMSRIYRRKIISLSAVILQCAIFGAERKKIHEV